MNTPRTDAALHPMRQRNDTTYESLVQHARKLETEVQELRAALEKIALGYSESNGNPQGLSGTDCAEIARAALAKVPK